MERDGFTPRRSPRVGKRGWRLVWQARLLGESLDDELLLRQSSLQLSDLLCLGSKLRLLLVEPRHRGRQSAKG